MAGSVGVDSDSKLGDDRRVFLTLLVATLVCSFLPLPFRLAGLGFGIWAVVLGFRLLALLTRRARSGQTARGHLGIAVGLGAIAVMLLDLVGQAVYLPAYLDRQECLDGATTVAAQQVCEKAFEERIGSGP